MAHLLAGICSTIPGSPPNCFSGNAQVILADIINASLVLVPALVVIGALHKLTEHRESSGALLIEMVVKAGGAFLIILLIRSVFGV